MSITFGNRNVKETHFGSRKVAKVYLGNQLIWPKFIPVPFDDNVLFTYGNTDKIFRFKATKAGYTDEAVWKSVYSFNPPWLYKDGIRIEPTIETLASKEYTDDYWCYLNTDVQTLGTGIYYLDLKIKGADGVLVPHSKTRRCGGYIVVGDIIADDALIINGEYIDRDDKLVWTLARGNFGTDVLKNYVDHYTIIIDSGEPEDVNVLEYSTASLGGGEHNAIIKAISKLGTQSNQVTITFNKSSIIVVPNLINNTNNKGHNVGPILKFDAKTTISEITTYFGANPTWSSGGVKIIKVNTDDWVNDNYNVGKMVSEAEVLSVSKTVSDSITVDEVTFYRTTLKLSTNFTFDANEEYVIVMYPAQIHADAYSNATPVWDDRWTSSHDGYNSNVIGYMRFDGNCGMYVKPSKITNEYPWLNLK